MTDKAKSLYFLILAMVYLAFTVVVAGHGLHITNIGGFVFMLLLSGYFYLKHRKSQS